jgi:hypothetical protein
MLPDVGVCPFALKSPPRQIFNYSTYPIVDASSSTDKRQRPVGCVGISNEIWFAAPCRTHGAATNRRRKNTISAIEPRLPSPGRSLCLHDIVLGQFACKVRHALIRERPFEHHVLETDFLGRGVAKILDIPTFVDARNAMTESTVRTLRPPAGLRSDTS